MVAGEGRAVTALFFVHNAATIAHESDDGLKEFRCPSGQRRKGLLARRHEWRRLAFRRSTGPSS
jgi:hypothetical protein